MGKLNVQSDRHANNHPFIIWTLRRAGGTNLGQALFSSSNYSGVEHEPFNEDRIFGHVTKAWNKSKNRADLYDSVDKILSNKPLIKHCLEIMPEPVNIALMELSIKHGYKHLFLYREKPTDRLLSLNYAQQTNVWGKKQKKLRPVDKKVFSNPIPVDRLVDHEYSCRKKLRLIYKKLIELGEQPLAVSFEQLYLFRFEYARNLVQEVYQELGVSLEQLTDDVLFKMLKGGAQGTKDDYLKFPLSEELIKATQNFSKFNLHKPVAFTFKRINKSSQVCLFETWRVLPSLKQGYGMVSGLLLLNTEGLTSANLKLVVNDEVISIDSGLSSKKTVRKDTDVEVVENCRFLSKPFLLNKSLVYFKLNGSEIAVGELSHK